MGGSRMKLLSLEVKELYRCYDYNVDFNSDVTFLYGMNGCGKTTILNITEAIITGQLFKLFNYKFSKIILKYVKNKEPDNEKTIKIISNKTELYITFENNEYTITMSDFDDDINVLKDIREISRIYSNKYDFLLEIQKTFNYVYLPLNRSYATKTEYQDVYTYRAGRFFTDDYFTLSTDSKDVAMMNIETLIYKNHSRISSTINRINDSFRDSILKSQIEVHGTFDFDEYVKNIQKTSITSLEKTQQDYIKILKELNLIDTSEEENYNRFFTHFIEEFSQAKQPEGEIPLSLNLLIKFQETSRIKKTIEIAEKMEQRKAAIKKPIETFLNTMNSFIYNDIDKKEICIDNDGHVYFKTKYNNKISIHHLSSGEKQLITFFANLIFNVNSKSSGIFVVDEPELSLHLSWQKIFIDKVLEINNNIQLIFATHAPEIVGKRRDKMYRLEKKYIGEDKKNG